jgi:hypothetical protein
VLSRVCHKRTTPARAAARASRSHSNNHNNRKKRDRPAKMAFLFKKKKKKESKSSSSNESKGGTSGSSATDSNVAKLRAHFKSLPKLNRAKFQVGTTLGTGTFGRVRLVTYYVKPNKPLYFALKMLKKSEIIRLKQVEHIKSEKNILCAIMHPFIVNLYCTFQDERMIYMTMEYVIGGELFSQLRKVGRFNNETARFYAAEIVLALEYLHSKVSITLSVSLSLALSRLCLVSCLVAHT